MAASSSRRALRREPSSDGIEEEPSQAATVDEVQDIAESHDEDEIEASRPTRLSKKAKKEKKKKATSAEDQEQAGTIGKDLEAKLAELKNNPVDKTQAKNIGGFSTDWKSLRTAIHSHSYPLLRDVASTVAEFAEGGAGSETTMATLEATMRKLVDTENELRAHEQALLDLQQKVAQGEVVIDPVAFYDEEAIKNKSEYKMKTSRKKYAKNDAYASYRQNIWEVEHPGEPMPPVSDLVAKEQGDDSDDEDEVAVGGVTQVYKCPLTLTPLVDPLTSNICGHSFNAAAIREFLGTASARKKCPTTGCNKTMSLSDLQPDKELAKKAKEAARRERMREEEDDDDEEVIE